MSPFVRTIPALLILLCCTNLSAQELSGTVRDAVTRETIIGAAVKLLNNGAVQVTDIDGRFTFRTDTLTPPFRLSVSFIGYTTLEQSTTGNIELQLQPSQIELKDVNVTGTRITEKQKQAPLTVESMDIIAVRESPQTSFYESLGTLKGVDMTSASLGFTIVNTRGFNSTSPVRSLQIIDGVDNQSPGLNFSLGNFLGSSELDVLKVDLIAGASSAFYGPNAFNGVISMTTRSPFVKPGLEVSVKAGERNLVETAVRWAQVFRNDEGFSRFGYKINLFYMRAKDWEAHNMDPAFQSADNATNPGGYDAVNRYGDEDVTGAYNAMSLSQQAQYPGLKRWYRTGYREADIVDYNSQNFKAAAAFHYRMEHDREIILASNFGAGTTVYQGDNRYSLNDILFFQNRLEFRKEGKYFIRAYATHEDAGNSYDAVFTAILMQNAAKSDALWGRDYRNYWINNNVFSQAHSLPGFPPYQFPYDTLAANHVLAQYHDLVQSWHDGARAYADSGVLSANDRPFFVPGTARFDSLFDVTTHNKTYREGGSGFYDKSALYHIHGEYKLTPAFCEITLGGNNRLYRPNSQGTIFSDTTGERLSNYEYGAYAGFEKKVLKEKLKLNLTGRIDKNENFDYLVSPALSAVYTVNDELIFRLSFSAAIRNPTLADQYLYYNVGRAILLGNITGYDSLATIESLRDYTNSPSLNTSLIRYFSVDPVRPERVRTIEGGVRTTLLKNLYADINYYFSYYYDFIGYRIGADLEFQPPPNQNFIRAFQVYRIASNAEDRVITQGGSVGLNYYFGKFYALTGNYSYNFLDKSGSDDPLIPAFNTPHNKFNIGVNGRNMDVMLFKKFRLRNFGFSLNYKWVEGYDFEGSPQFTGFVPTYDVLDGQLNYKVPRLKTTFKVGASNILDKRAFQVYGGPEIGRLAYFSVLVELNK